MRMMIDPKERERLGIISNPNQAIISRGKRLIVLNSMNDMGFIDNALWTNVTEGVLSDYHQDMNSETFEVRKCGINVMFIV